MPQTYVISDLNGEEMIMKKDEKDDKVCVKCKNYNYSFKKWSDKKDIDIHNELIYRFTCPQ